jgi:hypothetical protein
VLVAQLRDGRQRTRSAKKMRRTWLRPTRAPATALSSPGISAWGGIRIGAKG